MKCAVVECHEFRVTYGDSRPFCAVHEVEYLASPEAKQPNRGPTDFMERRWKESAVTASLARGNKPGDGPKMEITPEERAQAEALERDRLARLKRWKMPVIAKPISPGAVTGYYATEPSPEVAAQLAKLPRVKLTTEQMIEIERRQAAEKWQRDPPADLTEKEKLK